jgi:hypothetical protein
MNIRPKTRAGYFFAVGISVKRNLSDFDRQVYTTIIRQSSTLAPGRQCVYRVFRICQASPVNSFYRNGEEKIYKSISFY